MATSAVRRVGPDVSRWATGEARYRRSMAGEAHIFLAMSLDGFIAGPGDDLSWLPGPGELEPGAGQAHDEQTGERVDHGFDAFMASVGAILMGRRTYEVVKTMHGDWLYGETPLLV